MTKEQFDYILQLIGDGISKQNTYWKKGITPRERLAILIFSHYKTLYLQCIR